MTSSPPTPLPPTLVVDPHGTYARLREQAPVHRFALPNGDTVWIVTGYEQGRAALADPRLSLSKTHAPPGAWKGFSLPPALDANLLNLDPPDHTRLRRLVSQGFTPRRVEELRPRVTAVAEQLLAPIAASGGGDLVAEFAARLPVTVICEVLGIPAEHRGDLRNWAATMLAPPPDDPEAGARAVAEVHAFLVALITSKRDEPGDDILSAIVAARDDEDRLSEEELLSMAFLVLVAGYENAVNGIGLSLLTLLRHPQQWAALRADPALLPGAVRELARYEPPAPVSIRRFAVTDLEIGGTRIPAGDTVMVAIADANRDPRRWSDPEELVLGRDTAGELSLGHGIHYCLGAPLARLEIEVAIEATGRLLPTVTLGVQPAELRWRESFRTRALLSLPVRL